MTRGITQSRSDDDGSHGAGCAKVAGAGHANCLMTKYFMWVPLSFCRATYSKTMEDQTACSNTASAAFPGKAKRNGSPTAERGNTQGTNVRHFSEPVMSRQPN